MVWTYLATIYGHNHRWYISWINISKKNYQKIFISKDKPAHWLPTDPWDKWVKLWLSGFLSSWFQAKLLRDIMSSSHSPGSPCPLHGTGFLIFKEDLEYTKKKNLKMWRDTQGPIEHNAQSLPYTAPPDTRPSSSRVVGQESTVDREEWWSLLTCFYVCAYSVIHPPNQE